MVLLIRRTVRPRGYASAPSLAAAVLDSLFELPAGTIEVLAHQDSYPQSANLGQHEQFVNQRAQFEVDHEEDWLVYRILRAGEQHHRGWDLYHHGIDGS